MRTLKDLFQKKDETPKAALDEKTIFYLFQRIIRESYGERGAAAITPAFFERGVLGVKTKSPLWANELWLHRTALCERLNQEIGSLVVMDLKLTH